MIGRVGKDSGSRVDFCVGETCIIGASAAAAAGTAFGGRVNDREVGFVDGADDGGEAGDLNVVGGPAVAGFVDGVRQQLGERTCGKAVGVVASEAELAAGVCTDAEVDGEFRVGFQ